MSLVRMTWRGEAKFIRSAGVTEIRPIEEGVRVEYGRDDWTCVDGSPDEVFKALFNPPEAVPKADVARFFDALDDVMREARYGRPVPSFTDFVDGFRRDLGVERKR